MWEYNSLYHHGILGQKWGKRNGPPYPLGAGDHSAAERKAGWRKSLDQKKDEKRKLRESKNRGTLTDKELRDRIERLKMEKELRMLTNEEVKRGKRAVGEYLLGIGKESMKRYATNALSGAALYLTSAAIAGDLKKGGNFDKKQFAQAVFNGGPKKK